MVIAGHQQHATVFCGAGVVHVLERVDAAVHARTLGIPQGKYAVVNRLSHQMQLLGSPDRGGGDFFIDAWKKADMVRIQVFFCGPESFVQPTQRGAPVAGNKTRGVQAGRLIPDSLDQRQANQRLDAAQINAPRKG